MNYKLIIVRYGEIALKGKETRIRFENILVNNIKNALNAKNFTSKIRKEWGRIFVYTSEINKCIDVLQKIFGITSVSPAIQTEGKIDSISKIALEIAKEKLNNKTSFAIRTSRTGEHDFSSQDVAIQVGNDIVNATKAKVNLTKPDFKLFIEIRNDKAYLFTEKIRGTGGMPLGTQGNVIAIIDSMESILASWYLMRRGCKTIFLNTKESYKDVLASFMNTWFVKSDVFSVNSSNQIFENIDDIISKKNCKAIVTGHSINENSEEVLSDIRQLKNRIDLPILFPLIAMDDREIKTKYTELGLKE